MSAEKPEDNLVTDARVRRVSTTRALENESANVTVYGEGHQRGASTTKVLADVIKRALCQSLAADPQTR